MTKNKKRGREDEQDLKREIVSAEKAGTTETLTLQMSEPVKGIFEERKKWVDCEVRGSEAYVDLFILPPRWHDVTAWHAHLAPHP